MQTLSHSQAHTQGPWSCAPGEFFSVYSYVDGEPIAVPKTEANAALIAAAPDLLGACRKALYALKGREHDQFLRDAIAKATGGAA